MAPPYYEGIAVQGLIREVAKSDECHWYSQHTLTLEQVTGQGLCIGKVPTAKLFFAIQLIPLTTAAEHLIPTMTPGGRAPLG